MARSTYRNRNKLRGLAIGDLHAPFMHADAVAFLRAVKADFRPDYVVVIGDVADQHALSRFPRNPSGMSSGHELKAARRQLRPVYRLFPDALVCWGNHDRRIYDRATEAGIPEETIRDMSDILRCPAGWRWRDSWDVNGITFEHGTGTTGKEAHIKAARGNMGNTVIGHIHAHAGIAYVANRKHLFFGFNIGCLIDHEAYAFAYGKPLKDKPIIAVGLIEGRVPRLLPMPLSRGGRWNGKL